MRWFRHGEGGLWPTFVAPVILAAVTLSADGLVAQSGTDGLRPGSFSTGSGPTAVDWIPVLLVPGWSDGPATMEPLEALLEEAGWPAAWVERIEFRDPVGSNVEHARELSEALDRLRKETGAERVDLVAHSMGGLAARYLLVNGGADAIRRVVFVATPHRGTLTAYLAWGEGGKEMHPGSMFLMDLQAFRSVPSGIEALTVRTKVDFHVLPPESATLVGVPDVEICCPTHEGLLSHPEAFDAVYRFLTRGEPSRTEAVEPREPPSGGPVPPDAEGGPR